MTTSKKAAQAKTKETSKKLKKANQKVTEQKRVKPIKKPQPISDEDEEEGDQTN